MQKRATVHTPWPHCMDTGIVYTRIEDVQTVGAKCLRTSPASATLNATRIGVRKFHLRRIVGEQKPALFGIFPGLSTKPRELLFPPILRLWGLGHGLCGRLDECVIAESLIDK
jgi:hypothetical protein